MNLIKVPKSRVYGYVVLIVVGMAIYGIWSYATGGRSYAAAPLKDLGQAARTQIVATLDTPIEPGKNAVWCASFVAAWKRLQNDLAGGPLESDGAKELVVGLDSAADPAGDVPPGSLYAVAGWARNGIGEKIRKDVAKQFPSSPLPKLPQLGPMDLLAYARLEVSAKFPIPYSDAPWAMAWTDGVGQRSQIRSFGIHESHGQEELRARPRVLYAGESGRSDQFAIDLNDPSQPVQILVAQISRKSTLGETLTTLDAACKASSERMIESDAMMLVPEMAWRIEHEFAELAGLTVQSGPLKNYYVRQATQMIEFRLDRSGAELRSEAAISARGGKSSSYVITGPFLLVMRQRTSPRPFLVMWVENDELLRSFSANK